MAMFDWLSETVKVWRDRRLRWSMRVRAEKLIAVGILEPKVLHYIEALEFQVDSLRQELRALRIKELGERLADVDEELDLQEERRRSGTGRKEAKADPASARQRDRDSHTL
jgi:hypothetical protein